MIFSDANHPQIFVHGDPWKNGGGITHEALRVPAAAEFRWRVSVAQIEASGPFSDFAGYQRTLLLLRGDGVRLAFQEGADAYLRNVGDMVRFDGALQTQCTLLGGACVDLNLMAAKSLRTEAWVEPVAESRTMRSAAATLIFVIEGTLAADGHHHQSTRLEPWDLAVMTPGDVSYLGPAARDQAPPLVFFATLDDNSF